MMRRASLLLRGGRTFYVATTGNDGNPGTLAFPFATLAHAQTVAVPGTVIYLRGGTYLLDDFVDWDTSGVAVLAYPGEVPVLDGTNIPTPGEFNSRVLRVHDCSNVSFTGIDITEGPDGGVQVNGMTDSVMFVACRAYRNGRASVAEGQGFVLNNDINGGADQVTNCLLWNCDSYFNYDVVGGGQNADGFQVSAGAGNELRGCRAWRNADDGFDFFNISFAEDQTIAPVTVTQCWAWENGIDEAGTETAGDGNGFKLGGQRPGLGNSSGGNIVTDCMSWANREIGFTDNEATDPNTITFCVAYNNQRINIEGGAVAHVIQNSIAYLATEDNVSIANTSAVSFNSWDISGLLVTSLDWMTVDDATAAGARQANGDLPETSFLVLRGNAPYVSDMIGVGIDGANLGPQVTPETFVPPAPQAETTAIVNAYSTALTTFEQYMIDTVVVRLKDAAIWSELDGLWMFMAPDAASALINWKNPGTYNMVGVAGPTFTAWAGYAGNGSTSYLDSGVNLNALANYQQDDASLFVYSLTDLQNNAMKDAGDTSFSRVQLQLSGSPAQTASCYLNSVDYANGINADAPSTIGLFCAVRANGTQARVYVNNTAESSNPTQASTAPPAEHFVVGQASGAFSTRQFAAAGIGAALTKGQVQGALYEALYEYIATMGP